MSIRWNIQDRVSGKKMVLEGPEVFSHTKLDKKSGKVLDTVHTAELKQADKIRELVKVCSNVGRGAWRNK